MTRSLGAVRKLPTLANTTTPFPHRVGRSFVLNADRHPFEQPPHFLPLPPRTLVPSRSLAQVRQEPFSESWFTSSRPGRSPADDLLGTNHGGARGTGDHKPPDERTLKLGKTLRTLSPLLPNILTQPLPPSILSPTVSLHLFPSTHPHLPAVKGKVPYRAALWTAPVAWGCVPLVGNVKLQILSEKIVRTGYVSQLQSDDESRSDLREEKLVVRWKTEERGNGVKSNPSAAAGSPGSAGGPGASSTDAADTGGVSAAGFNRGLSKLLGGDKPIFNLNQGDAFSGLFIFTFDSDGRIATHTIEHADESNGTDHASRVVNLTDWLLSRARWRKKEVDMIPGLAMSNLKVCRRRIGGQEDRSR